MTLVLRKKVEALPSVVGQNKRKMPKENTLSVCHELKPLVCQRVKDDLLYLERDQKHKVLVVNQLM